MPGISATLIGFHPPALHAAAQATLGAAYDGSSFGPDTLVRIHLRETSPELDSAAQAVLDAHDPIFVTADKTVIDADGIDTATITVRAPKQSTQQGAAVTLLIGGTPVPVPLTAGVGTLTITSLDPAIIPVTVENPANRSTDTLTVEAR